MVTLCTWGCQPVEKKTDPPTQEIAKVEYKAEKATIYHTTEGTTDRITNVGDIVFVDYAQPTERQPSVFVDPTHTFQTMVGIGGALTDASAEVFAKLPADKQREFLDAYYSNDKGIGYTIARTNIASYDYVTDGDAELTWLERICNPLVPNSGFAIRKMGIYD